MSFDWSFEEPSAAAKLKSPRKAMPWQCPDATQRPGYRIGCGGTLNTEQPPSCSPSILFLQDFLSRARAAYAWPLAATTLA